MGLQQCTSVTMCMSVNGISRQPPFCIICSQAYLAHVDYVHSVQGRLDQILSTEICMKVVECVQILCKMQVSILRLAFWTQTNKMLHRHQIQFFLEESDCLAIRSAIEGMVEGVLTEIIVSCIILCHQLSQQRRPNYPCP